MSFTDYIRHGWRLCPIAPGQKGPTGAAALGWNRSDTPQKPIPTGWGAGLCHAYSGTCAIDIDNTEVAAAWLAERGVSLDALVAQPDAVMISSGRPNRAKLLYRLPAPLQSVKTAPFPIISPKTGKPITLTALDFRSATKDGLTMQDVLPGSIHPDTGMPYEWRYTDELIGHWSAPPEIPAELLAIWKSILADSGEVSPEADTPAAPKGIEFEEIERVLAKLDPDMVYNDWIRVGAALHHETKGAREGLLLWNSWSAKGSKYEGIGDLEPHWRSFKHDTANPVTLGSLLADVVASIDEFGIVPEGTTDVGEDTRPDSVMRKLLETRLVFVHGQDRYYDLSTDTWLNDRAIKHLFCPLVPDVIQPGANGKPDKVVRPDPVKFLMESESKFKVDSVVVRPGAERIFEYKNRRYVNRFIPEPVEPLRPKPHELEAFNFLWLRMKDPVFREWLMKFYGHAVQRPGVKMQTAPILYSEAQGSGKNTIARTVPERLFGSRWVRTMSGDVLSSSFNDVLGETWWLYLDELRSGVTKSERIYITNKTKSWITDDTLDVHPKGLKAYNTPNFIQITATSNFEDALQLDNNDRRWAVGELGNPIKENEALDLFHFLHSDRAPGVLRFIFGQVSLTGFNPTARAPSTQAKKTMVLSGIGSWESTLVERMAALSPPFDRDIFTVTSLLEQNPFRGQPPTAVTLGRILSKQPFNCRCLPNYSKVRLLAWRNVEKWAGKTHTERLAHMETGQRPAGKWSDEIPPAIRAMTSDAAFDSQPEIPVHFEPAEDVSDLL